MVGRSMKKSSEPVIVRDDVFLPCKEDSVQSRAFDPETGLFRAVVAAAFMDAFVASDSAIGASEPSKRANPAATAAFVREEARKFLTATSGGWFRARVCVCDAADLCPERTRKAALALMASIERGEDARLILGRTRGRAIPMTPESELQDAA
jgi:hypothetical protein